jgi:hypothetical protein
MNTLKCKNCQKEWSESQILKRAIGNKGEIIIHCPFCGDNCFGLVPESVLIPTIVSAPEPVSEPAPKKTVAKVPVKKKGAKK